MKKKHSFRPETRILAVLSAAVLLTFGVFRLGLGFYVDDWTQMLGILANAPHQGIGGLLASFHGVYFYLRPLNMVYYPLAYWVGGTAPWKYQLLYLLIEAACAAFLFKALFLATRNRALSFLAALLFALYPNHGGSRYWNNQVHPSQFFFYASLFAYASWLECRKTGRAVLSAALFLAAGLNYEAHVPLVLAAAVLGTLRRTRDGVNARRAAPAALVESWPMLASAALILVYNVTIQRLYPSTVSRKMAFSLGFALKVLERGVECSSTAMLALFAKSVPLAWRDFPWWLWLLGAAGVVLLSGFLVLELNGAESGSRETWKAWLWGATVLFVAGYLPYAVSADKYVPHIFDMQNRINEPASLGAAMAFAALLYRLRGSRAARAVLASVLVWFVLCDWQTTRSWENAWRAQTAILDGLKADEAAIPSGAVVVLDAPTHVENAPVFTLGSEFSSALNLFVRKGLRGAVLSDPISMAALPPGAPRVSVRYEPAAGLRVSGASQSAKR